MDRPGDAEVDLSVEARVERTAARIRADAKAAASKGPVIDQDEPLAQNVDLGDGAVKDVLVRGAGWRFPKELDSVRVRVRNSGADDAVWRTIEAHVMDGGSSSSSSTAASSSRSSSSSADEGALVQLASSCAVPIAALELGLRTMKVGEVARITANYGIKVAAEVELVELTAREETWNMEPCEKVAEARHRRALGSAAFRGGDLDRAMRRYGEAMRYLKLTKKFSGEDEKNAHAELVLLHANCAAIHLKRNELEHVVKQCSLALLLAPQHPKALFRRGTAYARQDKWAEAELDFAAALALEPTNRAVRAALAKLKEKKRAQKKRERAMFGGKGLFDSSPESKSPSSARAASSKRGSRGSSRSSPSSRSQRFSYAQQALGEPTGLIDGMRRGFGAAAHEASGAMAQLSPLAPVSTFGCVGIGALRALVVLLDQVALGAVATASTLAGDGSPESARSTPSTIARSVAGVGGGVSLGLRALMRGATLGVRALTQSAAASSVGPTAAKSSAARTSLGALLGAVGLLCHTSGGVLTCVAAVGRGVAISLGAGVEDAAGPEGNLVGQKAKEEAEKAEKAVRKRQLWGAAMLLVAAAGVARVTTR